MNKKVMAVILIAVLFALTFSIELKSALANGPSYYDPPYPDSAGFCECEHDYIPGYPEDSMVGLGVSADYDTYDHYPVFIYGRWQFMDQAGGNIYWPWENPYSYVMQNTPMQCAAYVNINQGGSYSDSDDPQWGYCPNDNAYYKTYWVEMEMAGSLPYVYSIEGANQASFYDIGDTSGYHWWIYCWTQPDCDVLKAWGDGGY